MAGGTILLESLTVSSPTIALGTASRGGLTVGGGASSLVWNGQAGFTASVPAFKRSEWALTGGNLSLGGPDGGTRFVLAVDGDKLGVYKYPAGSDTATLVTYFR